MTPEARAVAAIRSALEARGCMVLKIHGNEFMPKGTPDLFVAVPGALSRSIETFELWDGTPSDPWVGAEVVREPRLAVIEVKAPGGSHPTSKLQERALRRWAAAGALAGVCRTPEEALVLCGLV